MTINEEEFENFVFLQALENAVNFKGKANPKALIGKCMPKFPEIKNDMKTYMAKIDLIVNQVNSMSQEEQKKNLLNLNPKALEKKEKTSPPKKDGLPQLENIDKNFKVRIEPAPSGYLHLGHIFPIVANYELKKKYSGKFVIRLADTNPDNIKLENYEKVIEDINWLCENDIDEIYYQSDRLSLYYKHLRTLIETKHAYICKCDSETFKAYTDAKQECPCAKKISNLNNTLLEYDKFFTTYAPGEAVIRFKADITHKNPAMRSFSLARINTNKHARVGTKYRVWPTMHLAVAIDDVEMNITHVIRGKDHEINMERQKLIHKALGMKSPEYFHIGRMKFVDLNLSKTELSKKIEHRIYTGWDDPRVPSILSHRKRGYKALAFRKFILSLGISKRDSKITAKEYYKGLDYFNKQILEKESDRYFFVYNPKTIHITNTEKIPLKEITLPKHPENKSKGTRHFKLENTYFITSTDFDNLNQNDMLRLMHFANFKIIEKTKDTLKLEFISQEYDKTLPIKRNIHFVPASKNEKIKLIMQDNSTLNGIAEDLNNLKPNSNIQFERFGFVKYDSKDENGQKKFYFTHQ